MPTFNNIINNYIANEKKFRKAASKYSQEVVKEFNKILPHAKFAVETVEIETETTISVEIILGNDGYKFILTVYYFDKIVPNSIGIYKLLDEGTTERKELGLSATPKEVAEALISYLDPQDVVKFRGFSKKIK